MIVEFDTVRSSLKESQERDLQAELHGASSVPFHRSEDYITQMTIDLDRVIEFTGGKVWYNDEERDCVFVYNDNDMMSPNLLITYKDFKTMLEQATGRKVFRHEEV